MKRIKCDEIQKSIQKYVSQRNLLIPDRQCIQNENPKLANALGTTQPVSSVSCNTMPTKNGPTEKSNTTIGMEQMALNDLTLIESSINDYYSLSLSSDHDDYMQQFFIFKRFINEWMHIKSAITVYEQLKQLLFPTFVYCCIDLVSFEVTIANFVGEFVSEFGSELDSDQQKLLHNLLEYDKNRDLNKCALIKRWTENKSQIRLDSKSWNTIIKFLSTYKVHLLLRIINVNIQVILDDICTEFDEFSDPHAIDEGQTSQIKQEFDGYVIESERLENQNTCVNRSLDVLQNESFELFSTQVRSTVSTDSLNECIEKVRMLPSRLNGVCCYYTEDLSNKLTSSDISADAQMMSVTTESSSIYIYDLHESNGNSDDNKTAKTESSERKVYKCLNSKANNCKELVGGHSGAIFKAKFTHDSKYLLSCSNDGLACLWNASKTNRNSFRCKKTAPFQNAKENCYSEENDIAIAKSLRCGQWSQSRVTSPICSYSGHGSSVWDIEPFSCLNLFATSSKDGTARLWSFDRLYPLRIFCGHQADVNTVRFHPNGSYLATGSSDKTVRLWSVQTSDFVRLFSGHRSRVFSMCFSPDGNYLASGGEDRKIKVWDLRSGLLYKELKGHTDIVHSLSFDNASELLCSGGLDKSIKIWDLHQKGITLDPDTLSLPSESNNSVRSSHSAELIRSVYVDFHVYSTQCNTQNIFYVSGARKTIADSCQRSSSIAFQTPTYNAASGLTGSMLINNVFLN